MQYHHLLSSRKCKVKNKEVRTRIAILAGKLAIETLNPLTLEAYVSCGLIPQDKNPGLFWLMCGEVLHRIVDKFICLVLKIIYKLQLDLSKRQLDYSPDQKQLSMHVSIVYDACLKMIGLMLWFWLMSEMLSIHWIAKKHCIMSEFSAHRLQLF